MTQARIFVACNSFEKSVKGELLEWSLSKLVIDLHSREVEFQTVIPESDFTTCATLIQWSDQKLNCHMNGKTSRQNIEDRLLILYLWNSCPPVLSHKPCGGLILTGDV